MLFLYNADFNKNELQNWGFQKLSAHPSNPIEGQPYWNTTDDTLYIWSGSAWIDALSPAYTLPLAADGTRGGVRIGYTPTGANVPVQLSSEKMFVALTAAAINSAMSFTQISAQQDLHKFYPIKIDANGRITSYGVGANIVDNLISDSATDILSAKQGKALKTYIDSVVATTYKPKGTVTFANIPTSSLTVGDVYNISDAFTTDARFKEGAGKAYGAGSNIISLFLAPYPWSKAISSILSLNK